jgi:hypothetical protein
MAMVDETVRHSSGVAEAGLATGIVGTTLGVLNGAGGLLNLGGGLMGNPAMMASDNQFVNRYEMSNQMGCAKELMEKDLKIAELNTEVKLRDPNIYTDQKSLELYRYIDSQLNAINSNLSAQAVQNQATKDSFQIVNERIGCVKHELEEKICCETKARKCADNTLVSYMNATFYPKMVADVTVGTTTTAQTLYNPLPVSSCGCGC